MGYKLSKDITLHAVHSPDMDSMVRALEIALYAKTKKNKINKKRRNPT